MKLQVLVNAACAVAMSSTIAAPASAAALYTHGHGDIRAYYEDGELKLRYRLDGNAVVDGDYVDPVSQSTPQTFAAHELWTLVPNAPLSIPAEVFDFYPELAILGVGPDEPLWYLPQTQEPDRPWLGLSTDELDPSDWSHPTNSLPGGIAVEFMSIAGPAGGHFAAWDNIDFGNPLVVHAATTDGLDAGDSFNGATGFVAGSHAHLNWSFSKPGIYDVTVGFSAIHATDGYREAVETFRFVVAVPEPGAIALTIVGAVIAWTRGRKLRGVCHDQSIARRCSSAVQDIHRVGDVFMASAS